MKFVALECKPDETLIKALGINRKNITHQPNKGAVFNFLEKKTNYLGMVDEDPGAANPKFFEHFKSEGDLHDVEFYRIQKLSIELIVIKPRLEDWIVAQAKSVQLDLTAHSLPADGKQLHKVINARLPKFESVVLELMNRKAKGVLRLKELLHK
jgi:hypothetical protein